MEKVDPTALTVELFITDAVSAQSALNKAYDDLQATYSGTPNMNLFQGMYADELRLTGSFPHLLEAQTSNLLVNNTGLSSIFSQHYLPINTCIEVKRKVNELSESQISNITKEQIIAECNAIQAYSYFRLVQVFGGLPIPERTVPLDGLDANNNPRKSQAEVYQHIENLISLAENKINSTNPKTKFTNQALQVLKADVLLTQGKYPEAELVLQPLIGQFSLVPYNALFANSINNAAIFVIDFSTNDANALSTFYVARREAAPTQALIDAFGSTDARRALIGNPTNPATITIRKWTNSAQRPYIYRYSHVLLMYAEVLARRNDASAVSFLNEVRANVSATPVTVLDATNVVNVIANERLLEFYGEGDRWNTVKRLGIAPQIISSKPGVNFISRMVLWPIPQNELDRNSLINQADQNPGY
jgi:hypothetical protein